MTTTTTIDLVATGEISDGYDDKTYPSGLYDINGLNTVIKVTELTGNKIMNISDVDSTQKILVVNMCGDSSNQSISIYYSIDDGDNFTEIKFGNGAFVTIPSNSFTLLIGTILNNKRNRRPAILLSNLTINNTISNLDSQYLIDNKYKNEYVIKNGNISGDTNKEYLMCSNIYFQKKFI